jgi:hypothetical protein
VFYLKFRRPPVHAVHIHVWNEAAKEPLDPTAFFNGLAPWKMMSMVAVNSSKCGRTCPRAANFQ